MANIFVVSDTHFGHANILGFKAPDWTVPCSQFCRETKHYGHVQTKMRPFDTVDEMDETMIERWNETVRPQDKIYHLGDVCLHRKFLDTVMPRLNGHKRLVRGNHDIYPTKYYAKHFEDIYGVRVFENMVFSHIPLHPESVGRKWVNVHGHCHNNVLPRHFGAQYLNVCVEWTNYRPLSIEEVRQVIRGEKRLYEDSRD